MPSQNFTTAFLVEQSPKQSFDAINHVRGWWKKEIEGHSEKLNDEFAVHFGDVHYSRQRLIEFVPDKKVVWLVTDSRLTFIKDQSEWTGQKIVFDISKEGQQTKVRFTQQGLVPALECYTACSNAWSSYVNDSLRGLITTGKGKPG